MMAMGQFYFDDRIAEVGQNSTDVDSIELARAGRTITELAREFEAAATSIRKWVKQAALEEGLRSDGLTTAEREELNRLRRENRVRREEREILSKAAAWFAHETGTTPSRRSHS
jgi:transposase